MIYRQRGHQSVNFVSLFHILNNEIGAESGSGKSRWRQNFVHHTVQSHDIEMILIDLGDIQQILLSFPYPSLVIQNI